MFLLSDSLLKGFIEALGTLLVGGCLCKVPLHTFVAEACFVLKGSAHLAPLLRRLLPVSSRSTIPAGGHQLLPPAEFSETELHCMLNLAEMQVPGVGSCSKLLWKWKGPSKDYSPYLNPL